MEWTDGGHWKVDDDDDSASMIHEEDPSALRGREWDSMVFVSNTINDQFLFFLCLPLCIERVSFRRPRRGQGPRTLALRVNQRCVYNELTEQVITVIATINDFILVARLKVSLISHPHSVKPNTSKRPRTSSLRQTSVAEISLHVVWQKSVAICTSRTRKFQQRHRHHPGRSCHRNRCPALHSTTYLTLLEVQ